MDCPVKRRRGVSSTELLPWLLLLTCAGMLLWIGVRHRQLRLDLSNHRSDAARIQRGDFVPAFEGVSTAGERIQIAPGNARQVQIVYLLTSSCPYCRATLPLWSELARVVRSDSSLSDVRVIGLTSDSAHVAQAFADSAALPFPLVQFPELRLLALFKGQVVPQTAVLRGDGRVLYVRHQAITDRRAIDSVLVAISSARIRPMETSIR
jgi:peroxiredoxin